MKIVHICLACFFPDNYSYQENILPKFHKQLGYDVSVIASLVSFGTDGKTTFLSRGSTYLNEHCIQVTRLDYKHPVMLYKKLKRFVGTYKTLEKEKPDILFIHGCQFMDMDIVGKFIKSHKVRVYVDNHADFSNSATNWFSRNLLHRAIWRHMAHLIEPYTTKFYGVLPARVDFLKNIYKLPSSKCELLVMGADDELVENVKKNGARRRIRKQYGISDSDFLIMTGGKIDLWKKQTLLLMDAVKKINNPKVKLIVFGSVVPELKEDVDRFNNGTKIQFVGWIESKKTYDYFSAADLVVFPGRHSVLWEQVAGQGIPMLCKYWEGTTHIDLGGNVMFLKEDTANEIFELIHFLIKHTEKYQTMKEVASKSGMQKFSYKDISRRSIEESSQCSN